MLFRSITRLPTKTIPPLPLLRHCILRSFTLTPITAVKQMPPRPTVPESEISESFLKGSGPGGQKINKTASAVQLKHHPSGLVVKSQATRSRSQNRKIARRLLAEKLEVVEKGPQSRVAMREEKKRKKKASRRKKANRKYRALEEGGVVGEGVEGRVIAGGDGDEDGDGGEDEDEEEGKEEGDDGGKEDNRR